MRFVRLIADEPQSCGGQSSRLSGVEEGQNPADRDASPITQGPSGVSAQFFLVLSGFVRLGGDGSLDRGSSLGCIQSIEYLPLVGDRCETRHHHGGRNVQVCC